jgi:hypothetical protein
MQRTRSYSELVKAMKGPREETEALEVVRLEAIAMELSDLVVQTAEEKYPGVERVIGQLVAKIDSLSKLKGRA